MFLLFSAAPAGGFPAAIRRKPEVMCLFRKGQAHISSCPRSARLFATVGVSMTHRQAHTRLLLSAF